MSSHPNNPPICDPSQEAPRIDFELLCTHCGQSMEGAPLDGECPACNKPTADTLDLDTIDFETVTVSASVFCLRCGYNLRTLRLNGLCPECGHAVADALHRNILGLASPVWRMQVLRGINRLLFAMVAAPATFVGVAIGAPLAWLLPCIMAGIVIEAGVLAILAAGIFGVSTPDPQGFGQHESAWPRIVARTAILVSGLSFAGGAIGTGLGATIVPSTVPHVARDITAVSTGVFGLVSLLALVPCLRQIARRARDEALESSTRTWWILFIVTLVVSLLAGGLLAGLLATHTTVSVKIAEGILATLLLVTGVTAFLLYGLAFAGLLAYRKLLRRADARANPRGAPR